MAGGRDDRDEYDDRYDDDRPRRRRPRPAGGSGGTVWLVVGGVGCVVVLGCAGLIGLGAFWGFKAVTEDLPAATAAADQFFDLLRDGKIDEAYRSATADFRAGRTPAEFAAFVARHETLTRQTGRTVNSTRLFQDGGGRRVFVQVTLTAPNNALTCTAVLVPDGGAWKVNDLTVP